MNVWKPLALSAVLVAAMAAVSLWALQRLPPGALVATHFGLSGRPDRFAPAGTALWLMPAIAAGLCGLFAVLPRIMPNTSRLERSPAAYLAAWLGVVGMLAVVHLTAVAAALGLPVAPHRVVLGAVGVLLAVLGNFMGKIRYNYVMGVRTPWTLASERVWDRTHRVVGPLFVLWGLAVLVCAVAGWDDGRVATGMMAGGVGLIVAVSLGYSYFEARREGIA